MPRINRGLVDGGFYHVINRGNAKQEVFLKNNDYEAFKKLVREAKGKFRMRLYGYCLMPNHFHFVVGSLLAQELSEWMQWIMTSHVRRYHKYYGGSGHVWQGRFKSFLIQHDERFLSVLRYVEANPVRAGLVSSAVSWEWSSCAERAGLTAGDILDDSPVPIPSDWVERINQGVNDSEIESIRRSVNRQTPYGTRSWQEEVAEKFGLQSTLRSRGRPKKGDRLLF